MNLPWEPLLTVERSDLPELAFYGVISVIDGSGRLLVSRGEQTAKLWTRSCLKPWQLLGHLHILMKSYPQLTDRHYALMLSSHSAEAKHLEALDEMLEIAGEDVSVLQNTPRYPVEPGTKFRLKAAGEKPTSRWGSCSGKHLGFVMAMNAQGQDHRLYLEPDQPHFDRLKKTLAYLLNDDWKNIRQTTDGCRLPNYAFTAPELARLYVQLATDMKFENLPEPPAELQEVVANVSKLGTYMATYPDYVGGEGRFDTELMRGKYTIDGVQLLAKEGADGLLSIGVRPCDLYPKGLGIVIKLSSGEDLYHIGLIALELLDRLKLLKDSARKENKLKHVKFNFQFELAEFAKR